VGIGAKAATDCDHKSAPTTILEIEHFIMTVYGDFLCLIQQPCITSSLAKGQSREKNKLQITKIFYDDRL
jgi:hypothetical protein